jgi:methionine-rich copper-binding protein CopC
MRRHSLRCWSGRAALGAVVVFGALAWSAVPASAHNYLVGSSPEANAVVTEQPGIFTVTTNDDLLDLGGGGSGMAMQISGPAGTAAPLYYGDGCVTVAGPTAQTQAQLGQPGEYTVVWQVVSTDGHPVSGDFTFTWQPAPGQQLAEGAAAPPTCGETAASDQASPQSTTDAGGSAPDSTGAALSDVLWIGGGVLAVLLAVVVTLLAVARRRPVPPAGPADLADRSPRDE